MTQIKNNVAQFNNILILIKLSFALKYSIVYKRVYAILKICSPSLELSDCQLSAMEEWYASQFTLARFIFKYEYREYSRSTTTRCMHQLRKYACNDFARLILIIMLDRPSADLLWEKFLKFSHSWDVVAEIYLHCRFFK